MLRRPRLQYPWVRLRWIDAAGSSGCGDANELKVPVVYQEGWLIKETDDAVWVSNCVYIDDMQFANRDCIPKGCIIEMVQRAKVKPDRGNY